MTVGQAIHDADDTLGSAFTRVQQRWAGDPAQWLTFGMTLAMSQRILAEAGRPLDSGSEGALQGSVPVSDEPP